MNVELFQQIRAISKTADAGPIIERIEIQEMKKQGPNLGPCWGPTSTPS
jgi:hypothetical protein